MIGNIDCERIKYDAEIAIGSLSAIIRDASYHNLHPIYLKEKITTVQRCLDFMKLFTESEGKP